MQPGIGHDTVFFIGNGILRVPSWIGHESRGDLVPVRTPSWSDYMQELWRLARRSRAPSRPLLAEREFLQLSPPRQAEWFDRHFESPIALAPEERSALRLHLLGAALHSVDGLLTNQLLLRIARLVAEAASALAGSEVVDVFTTNLDCSLEQNIAWAIEQWCIARGTQEAASIEVMAGFRTSVIWRRSGTGDRLLRVRLWKIHGCLRDLKYSLGSEERERIEAARATRDELFGRIPTADALTPDLVGRWQAEVPPMLRGRAPAVFSISEYFENLARVIELGRSTSDAPGRAEFEHFTRILTTRPLMMLGYSLQDEDVDIVYLLQTYASTRERVIIMPERGWRPSHEERLSQMGIRSWQFPVGARGYCLEPGRLQRAARHEWRVSPAGRADDPWGAAIRRVVADAWLEPQRACLDELLRHGGIQPVPSPPQRRLVFAGLASIWHAFAVRRESDFPVPRRVSAGYTAVDTQVPGGSGLVPCLEAAAMAGPSAAGHIAFVTNVPRAWGSWAEIEEFCLSAGIDVRPHRPADDDPALHVGRTSYVLLWDLASGRSPRPKQRFIIDVPSHADERYANLQAELRSPLARIEDEFQDTDGDDLLFADKETEFEGRRNWRGPLIFETGSSGTELLGGQTGALRPTLWTCGVGSFLRTLIVGSGCLPADAWQYPASIAAVLERLGTVPELAPFLECPEALRRAYVAKLVSFDRPPWWEGAALGFRYEDELAYGTWMRDAWWSAGPAALRLLEAWDLLGDPHRLLGRGLLTTIHEGGLMAAWTLADGETLLTRVAIKTAEDSEQPFRHIVRVEACRLRGTRVGVLLEDVATIDVANQLTLSVGGESTTLELATPARWNTLAAGDTVRGALAFGLWSYAYERSPRPASLAHIAFASCVLATIKCYAGSFVNNLQLLEGLRQTPVWSRLWSMER